MPPQEFEPLIEQQLFPLGYNRFTHIDSACHVLYCDVNNGSC